ncbi:MAG: protein kinase [Burkholderiaceae bacterium]|nr:protein kinase [Burkholderiaceae bacterium]
MNAPGNELAERRDAAVPLAPGRRLGDFLLTRVIGQGGFGIVYEAEDLCLQRRVAIKEYMPSHLATRADGEGVHPISSRYTNTFELGRQSFVSEARLLAQFRHPGLLEVFHFWEQNGTAYMAMPFYEGLTLDRVLASKPGVVGEAWLKDTLAPVLDALEHMHAADCYHRDVSADNILILKNGKALLLDLGAARRVIGDTERALTVMLKPGYAPIEQYADDPACRQGPWTDIYALAAVLYFAVTGRMPPASASRVMHDSLPPLGSLQPAGYSLGFLEAIDRGLSIRPERRPRSIAEFRSLLHGGPVAGGTARDAERSAAGVVAPEAEGSPLQRSPGRRAPRAAAAAVIAIVALVAAAAWLRPPADPGNRPVASIARTKAAPGPAAIPPPATATATPAAVVSTESTPAAKPVTAAPASGANTSVVATPQRTPSVVASQAADGRRSGNAGARPTTAQVRPAGHDASRAPARPGRTGTVRLAVSPWGEVFVDGVSRGVSPPLKELALGAGPHRIELRNPAAPGLTREIVVGEGKATVITHRFK